MQVFDGESFFYYPRPPASQAEVPLNLKKDAAVNMLVKVSIIPAESCHCCATEEGCGRCTSRCTLCMAECKLY